MSPYPYKNDLGKQPPPNSPAARANTPLAKLQKKATEEQLAQLTAAKQKQMYEAFFGAEPKTIKFPNIMPKTFKGDFPNHPQANKYGKADLSVVPDEGPVTLYEDPEQTKLLDAIKAEYDKHLITKAEFEKNYLKAFQAKVVGELPAPQKVLPPGSFTIVDAGQPDAYRVRMQFKVDGIAGLDGEVLWAEQTVNKAFMWGSPKAGEKIVQDLFRQIQEMIAQKMKGK